MTDHLLDRLVIAVGTQYLVDAELGRGGMAVVYRATDLRLHRRVAIKVLPPELAFNADVRERFLREAQTAAQLAHPSIVPIFTVDEREGIVYFVMALVDGESLGARLAREGRLPIDETRRILSGVADALAYAHSMGVVHRDVKPDNIMLDRASGRPLVTDFGIARAAQGDSRLTVTGVAIGTPAYMSPEQALGERELDGRSDIYSLGVIGYQMLAGETPFKASNTPSMLMKHVSESPRSIAMLRPDTPSALAHAIGRALAKKPDDRWPDANLFRDAITETREIRQPADAAYAPPPLRKQQPPAGYAGRVDFPLLDMPPLAPLAPMAPVPWNSRDARRMRHEAGAREFARRKRHDSAEQDAVRPVGERIVRFRRKAVGSVATVGTLAAVNVLFSPHQLWFLIPTAFITLGVLTRAGRLWADGVPLGSLFSGGGGLTLPETGAHVSTQTAEAKAAALAPPEVLAGPYGNAVHRAAADRQAVHETLARLPKAERDMIPDVAPTIDALSERVGALASTLHRLDADVNGASLTSLDARLAALKAEAHDDPTPEQERRIALLERQRSSIGELTERRTVLLSQLESAALALQNLRLDLLKLRSSGLESAMSDVASATQEARALSRDIGNVVDAVREVRRL